VGTEGFRGDGSTVNFFKTEIHHLSAQKRGETKILLQNHLFDLKCVRREYRYKALRLRQPGQYNKKVLCSNLLQISKGSKFLSFSRYCQAHASVVTLIRPGSLRSQSFRVGNYPLISLNLAVPLKLPDYSLCIFSCQRKFPPAKMNC